jgi:hypothetical protein
MPDHKSRSGIGIRYVMQGLLAMAEGTVFNEEELGRTESRWRSPGAVAIILPIPSRTVDVDCISELVHNKGAVIYHANDGVQHRSAVHVIPFAVIPAKRRTVSVRPVNMQHTSWRANWGCPATILELYPGQSGWLTGGECPLNEWSGLNVILDNRDADACALDRNPLFNS